MIEFLHNNFGLPDGGLYSNLITSALLAGGAFLWGRAFERRSKQHHEQLHKELLHHIKKIHQSLGINK